MPKYNYVKLAEFESSMPAHSMRILLEANGIEAQVHGDFLAEIASVERIQLVVKESDLEMAKRVITCLLYTSPSPRDRTRSRMPSSA